MIMPNDIRCALEQYVPEFDGAACEMHIDPKDFVLAGVHPVTGVSFGVHVNEAVCALARLFVARCEEAGSREREREESRLWVG